MGVQIPNGKEQVWVEKGRPIVEYRDTVWSSVQKRRLNWSRCHLGSGLGWASGIICEMGSRSPWEGVGNFRGEGATPCKAYWHCAVICAKTAEVIEMPFGLWTSVSTGPTKHVLDGAQIPHANGHLLGERTCSTTLCSELCENGWTDQFAVCIVDLDGPKEAQVHSYSPGGANVSSWGHTGATWRVRLNCPSAAAMRPYVKLLWTTCFGLVVFRQLVDCKMSVN